MENEFKGLLALDALARKHGQPGLRPEFRAVLRGASAHAGANVVPLETPSRRAGPAEQVATPEALAKTADLNAYRHRVVTPGSGTDG